MRSPLLALTLPLALLVPVVPAAHAVPVPTEASADRAATARAEQARIPRLQVRRLVTGLDNPWDVKRLPSGTLLVTERDRARLSAYGDGARRTVRFPEQTGSGSPARPG